MGPSRGSADVSADEDKTQKIQQHRPGTPSAAQGWLYHSGSPLPAFPQIQSLTTHSWSDSCARETRDQWERVLLGAPGGSVG